MNGETIAMVFVIILTIGLVALMVLTELNSLKKRIKDLELKFQNLRDYTLKLNELILDLSEKINFTKQQVNGIVHKSGMKPVNIRLPKSKIRYLADCPMCSNTVCSEDLYCEKCGQKLNWSNEDDKS